MSGRIMSFSGSMPGNLNEKTSAIPLSFDNGQFLDRESKGEMFLMTNEKVYAMQLSKIYPLLVGKAVRKGRTQEEVDEVISWLTGYRAEQLAGLVQTEMTYQEFFEQAPRLNPNRKLIRGTVCGVRVEEIEEPLMRDIRSLDKLVDELAKGKTMEKILRKAD